MTTRDLEKRVVDLETRLALLEGRMALQEAYPRYYNPNVYYPPVQILPPVVCQPNTTIIGSGDGENGKLYVYNADA
jgi:hypothetical protein